MKHLNCILFIWAFESLPKSSSILISPQLKFKNRLNNTNHDSKSEVFENLDYSTAVSHIPYWGKLPKRDVTKQPSELREQFNLFSRNKLDLSSLTGVFDYEAGDDFPYNNVFQGVTGGSSRHDYYQTVVTTVTATKHFTSLVTSVVTDTKFEYLTLHSTRNVPVISYIPSYDTNYVTQFATAYVTQKFPVFKTKLITEHHTQLLTKTKYNTKYKTILETDQQTVYITKTNYNTEILLKTTTVHQTVTRFIATTTTEFKHIPYPTTTTLYDNIYFTSTFLVPHPVTTTVYELQYITITVPEVTSPKPKNHAYYQTYAALFEVQKASQIYL